MSKAGLKQAKRGGTAPMTRANGDQTKEKILDAAEELFGEQTFDTVSLRDITNRADVTLALASYHFGTKDNLFAAVVARRVHLLNDMRRERLRALEESGNVTVESLLDAFMLPLFQQMQSGDDGWRAYVHVISKLALTNRWLDLLKEYFDETANLFIERLRPLLPGLSEEELMRGFSFSLQLMLQAVSSNRRLDSLSGGRFTANNLDNAYSTLLKYTAAGLKGLLPT
ncbi:TetR/AcrR family transcriptional regulator [Rhizobium alvei]|uniref:TetR family transcriptional regulator n=1 Tax=Rhizobium alvei TaxID=1132659 RepID=A0ABT8YLP7_9HYPH|nr:TetR/AcrR family transcriptional regulator [Rhizobium alvei]MDO6964654.1 TetR family transcriptional regulator [Rhizobium alvei]